MRARGGAPSTSVAACCSHPAAWPSHPARLDGALDRAQLLASECAASAHSNVCGFSLAVAAVLQAPHAPTLPAAACAANYLFTDGVCMACPGGSKRAVSDPQGACSCAGADATFYKPASLWSASTGCGGLAAGPG